MLFEDRYGPCKADVSLFRPLNAHTHTHCCCERIWSRAMSSGRRWETVAGWNLMGCEYDTVPRERCIPNCRSDNLREHAVLRICGSVNSLESRSAVDASKNTHFSSVWSKQCKQIVYTCVCFLLHVCSTLTKRMKCATQFQWHCITCRMQNSFLILGLLCVEYCECSENVCRRYSRIRYRGA